MLLKDLPSFVNILWKEDYWEDEEGGLYIKEAGVILLGAETVKIKDLPERIEDIPQIMAISLNTCYTGRYMLNKVLDYTKDELRYISPKADWIQLDNKIYKLKDVLEAIKSLKPIK